MRKATSSMDMKDGKDATQLKGRTNEQSTKELNMSLLIIFLISIIDLLGFTVILPLMPSIFEYYDSNKEVKYSLLLLEKLLFQLEFLSLFFKIPYAPFFVPTCFSCYIYIQYQMRKFKLTLCDYKN